MTTQKKVEISQRNISLPTTVLGEHNPNPLFETYQGRPYPFEEEISDRESALADTGRGYNPYPYPYAYMDADRKLQNRPYLLLVMENEFLRVEVLPHLGSRIHRIFDKTLKQDLIHHAQKVVMQYIPGTSGGTYVGVGMELSIPDHHSLTNSREREYQTFSHEDGSASIVVGELDLRYKMRWSMELSLKPGDTKLHQKVTIQNLSEYNGRFRAWSNPGIAVNDRNLEIIFPEKAGWEHGGEFQDISWPVWDGIDLSYHHNAPNTLGVEAKDVENGFFAYYDHQHQYGMVHWADPADVKGKKYWAWSKDDPQPAFRLSDGQEFMELQSGRDEDQERFELIAPGITVTWDEVWYGVGELGTVSAATETLALAITGKTLKIQSTVRDEVEAVHLDTGKTLGVLKLAPGVVNKCPIAGLTTGTIGIKRRHRLIATVALGAPQRSDDAYIERIASEWPVPEPENPDSIMRQIRHFMRFGPRCKSVSLEGLINKLLAIDPGHAEGLKLRGISYAERELYPDALACLKQSLVRNEFDPETYYYLGLCHERLNDTLSADMAYGRAAKFGCHQAAWYRRGLLAMRSQDYVSARSLFKKATLYNGFHIPSRACYAWCLHCAGLKAEARGQLNLAAEIQVSNPLIEAMRYLIEFNSFKGFAKFATASSLGRQLHGDVQTYLQLACDISALGENRITAEIADEVAELTRQSRGRGIVPYYQYYFRSLADLPARKPKSGLSDLKYSFPFRHEEVAITEFALGQDGNDSYARYYRGMLYASKIRYREAFEYIKPAFDAGLKTPEVANILGRISDNTLHDVDLSQKYFEISLELDPDNLFTLNFMADLYDRRGNDEALEKLFQHPATLTNMDLFTKYVAHLRKHGRVNKAIEVYEKVDFSEMDQALCYIYFELLVQRGLMRLDSKDYRGALADFRQANVPPRNLGRHQKHRKRRNIQADYFVGKALMKLGKRGEAYRLWEDAIEYREQPQDWKMSGPWNYGFWTDRFYQGWMLKEMGRTSEAITYFDGIRAEAAHKFRHFYSPAQRRDLLNLAYNGLNDRQIYTKATDTSYLKKE